MFVILQRLVFMIRYQFFPARPPFVNTVYLAHTPPEQCVPNELELELELESKLDVLGFEPTA